MMYLHLYAYKRTTSSKVESQTGKYFNSIGKQSRNNQSSAISKLVYSPKGGTMIFTPKKVVGYVLLTTQLNTINRFLFSYSVLRTGYLLDWRHGKAGQGKTWMVSTIAPVTTPNHPVSFEREESRTVRYHYNL